jgi:hypothetical protein
MDLLNYFIAPFAVLFASKDGWLPRWLWWLQTPDNSLDGDNGWKEEHRPYMIEDTKFKQYVNRVRWLYRNSMYGFAIDVLGCKTLATDDLEIIGESKVSNRPLHEGLVVRKLIRDGKVIAFQWYYVNAWSDTRCIRINLGWKLWGFKKGENNNCQIVFSPNPFMGYSK